MNTATIMFDKTINKYVASYKGTVLCKSPDVKYLEKVITSGLNVKAKNLQVNQIQLDPSLDLPGLHYGTIPVVEQKPLPKFEVNERFEFVDEFATMVANKVIPSLVLVGQGGLGKTFTVLKSLAKAGLKPTEVIKIKVKVPDENGDIHEIETDQVVGDYVVVKGFSTAKAMYRTLYENRQRIIIFDDCDSINKDPNAINVLKAALDSYDSRWVSWNSENPFSDLPRNFLFTGGIIFISNLQKSKIDQAIRSRSTCVDLTMSDDEKIQRMSYIISDENFLPEFSAICKTDALNFIARHIDIANEISLRTLIQITKIRSTAHFDKWERTALYALTN